ncbi:TPA: hypothetical protein DCZ46_01245 [Candidatus Campbellbacteria bacterium]|nr:MAG: seg [Candidatus Campbellbacteria bacterium GW2011_OD1_34_28]KKP75289.1 MAG: hypothetical protein UR74_C0001G0145 [Candidatus Campbellbacteria bacterium GW2011_GWD2_35_24]KKP76150.1 MAG: hypothetical protein UR75_C0001G0184 [Candidatus Campbellbacteria bacterium GW2011_GWC2_35_28]KKP77339.1 MAG: hypothetical protein UR76_C0001G0184 [Candidatus Campbellbacteria bacterium GW2011_GWC1_35_31]KKP79268.1 MAG: hypothetical protein UR79_C0001G0184 [Candidatus Campbellbacteria bacterium GW2011_GW
MINFLKNKKIQIVSSAAFLFFVSFSVSFSAVEYKMLEKLPYINPNGEAVDLTTYLSGAFRLAFGVAILLAVFQLSFAGFKYLTEESFTGKTNAKSKINNAIFGLVLIFVSYLLLNFINPDLVNIQFEIPKVGKSNGS